MGFCPCPCSCPVSTKGNRAESLARLLLACLLLASCFELPPELPDDDGALDAHPPIAVYDPNPFAAKNRWFQRAFHLVDPDGSVTGVRGRVYGRPTINDTRTLNPVTGDFEDDGRRTVMVTVSDGFAPVD